MKIQISGHVVPVSHTHKQLSIIQTNQSSVHNNKQGIKTLIACKYLGVYLSMLLVVF